MSAYFSVGDRGYAPYQGGTNVYSLSDTLDSIHGKHEIRVGLVFRANEMNVRNNAFQDGYIVNAGSATGDNMGDFCWVVSAFLRPMIRHSWALQPAAAGNCFVPSCRTTGALPAT
jgi:hypothetical protein